MPIFHPGPRKALRAEAESLAGLTFDRIRIRPLSPTIGAEIEGVALTGEHLPDAATLAEIRRALLAYKVVFLRDQPVSRAQHVAFARCFGALEIHPFLPSPEGFPEIVVLAKNEDLRGYENVWHSDVTWRLEPSLGSVLRAHEVPAVGGDTLFCDMVAAYEGLPKTVKDRIDGLRAVHDFTRTFQALIPPEELAAKQREFPPTEHPVVRTHPETGRRALYVNAAFTDRIVGLEPAESADLLSLLYDQATVPEYQCRFRWRKDSLAFWDNRAAQHYAASDYWPQQRVMERATIIGDRPR